MKTKSILILAGFALSAFLFSCNNASHDEHAHGKYICPCGGCPEVKLDKGGDCPKCGMELVFRTDEEISKDSVEAVSSENVEPADSVSSGTVQYACPMKCTEEKFDHPAKCPVCGMDIEPVE